MNSFSQEVAARIDANEHNARLKATASEFMNASFKAQYSYNFSWLGRPIIQYPQDIVAVQEIIWNVQPDLIIETGIAHGGSLIFSASMLELNAACGGPTDGLVIGVDIDIRAHNRAAIEAHPMSRRIRMIQGSSIATEIVEQVREEAARRQRVLVFLDSNHTHEHVLAELEAYAPLTSTGSYCIVFDTLVEDLPPELVVDRPWARGDNPKTAVWQWLQSHPEFEIDKSVQNKLLVTVASDGFLRRIR